MRLSGRKFIKTGILFLTGSLLSDSLWIEKFFIEIKEFYTSNIGRGATRIKLIQLSDLHLQSVNSALNHLTRKINILKPDLIVLTGDVIDKSGNIRIVREFLGRVDKDIRKVAILGNWEYWGNINLEELKNTYLEYNCTLLINETIRYLFQNKLLSVTGVDDFIGGHADIETALSGYKESDYYVVLNHCPQYSDTISQFDNTNAKVDLILSGHTHGGQISLFGLSPFLPKGSGRYSRGWYDLNGCKLYVSKGIGTSILPVRFGARAEMAVFYIAL